MDHFRLIQIPPKDIPYYKDGYYKNNGIKIIKQNHNYKEDKYDFEWVFFSNLEMLQIIFIWE